MSGRVSLSVVKLQTAVVCAILAGILAPSSGVGQSLSISLQPVMSGLSGPVYLTNAGDGSGRLFVVEQVGRIRIYKNGSLLSTPFLDITSKVFSGGERGLLSVAFHPSYETNRRFFVYYTRQTDGDIVISEFAASAGNPDVADTTEKQLLLIEHSTYGNHNGGQLQFGTDGLLYIGTGDGGGGGDPLHSGQDINAFLGKILRIDVDTGSPYGIPSDNPYVGVAGLDEIYAVGMRNPWRFAFDRPTGTLYLGDVGQGAWEEIDVVTRGGNYGWNIMEGAHCYPPGSSCDATGLTLPIAEYAHAGGNCSVTGGYVYRGTQSPSMVGTYFYADYCTGIIWGLIGGVPTQLLDTSLNISAFGEDEAGELYVVGLGGTVSRIVGPSSGGTCTLTCPGDVVVTDADGNGLETVAYPSPSAAGTCGTITCSPPSGSAFPVGTTTVTCTSSQGGGSCSFAVIVLPPAGGSCTLTCPDDTTVVDIDGNGTEEVIYAAPQTEGTCGTVTGSPPSGFAFPVGTTVVTCSSSVGNGSCSFTVTVLDNNAPLDVTSCTPSQARRGQRLDVFIRGSGFGDRPTVSLGAGVRMTHVHRHSSAELHITMRILRSAKTGYRNVTVKNSRRESDTCRKCFQIQ